MGYFAHLGWSCVALNLRGHASPGADVGRASFADYLSDVQQVVAACEAPPVVLGHDLGGLLALQRALSPTRAIVALAPLVPCPLATTSNAALSRLAARIAMLRSRPLPAPRGRIGANYFAGDVPGGTTLDSGVVARELTRKSFGTSLINGSAPTLIVASEGDRFSPPDDAQRLATHVGATFRLIGGSTHAMPWDSGWEQRVSEIHRWLIQTLGDQLLAMREEEE
jgi:pimeloyl-ACP methyl ester carboxylesterase